MIVSTFNCVFTSGKHVHGRYTPLNSTLIMKNWCLQGYTYFFLFFLQNIDCGYSLEPPRRGDSNEYPHSCFKQKSLTKLFFSYQLIKITFKTSENINKKRDGPYFFIFLQLK